MLTLNVVTGKNILYQGRLLCQFSHKHFNCYLSLFYMIYVLESNRNFSAFPGNFVRLTEVAEVFRVVVRVIICMYIQTCNVDQPEHIQNATSFNMKGIVKENFDLLVIRKSYLN